MRTEMMTPMGGATPYDTPGISASEASTAPPSPSPFVQQDPSIVVHMPDSSAPPLTPNGTIDTSNVFLMPEVTPRLPAVNTPASTVHNTPRLPTAGLALFLDDEMEMGPHDVLGDDQVGDQGINGTTGREPLEPMDLSQDMPTLGSPVRALSAASVPAQQPRLTPSRKTLGPAVTASLARRAAAQASSLNAVAGRNTVIGSRPGTPVGQQNSQKSTMREEEFETPPLVPFTIVPGHNSGVVSTMLFDPTKRYLMTASGTRGWDGVASHLCLVYAVTPLTSGTNPPAPPSQDPADDG
ncbi:Transcription factor spt8 [Thoreauomyces humboldtii]|nr:Transcription factor spt8 [Thoreauomyces humboldtii]